MNSYIHPGKTATPGDGATAALVVMSDNHLSFEIIG